MIVIGFNWPGWHDHSVAVIVDGELVFASEEERWTRHKHSPDEPPINALKQAFEFLKNKYGIKPKDVDAYAVNFDPSILPNKLYMQALRGIIINSLHFGYFSGFYGYLSIIDWVRALVGAGFRFVTWSLDRGTILVWAERFVRKAVYDLGEELPSRVRVIPVPHHLAHAASAYYFSGFNNATVLTVDGSGEFESTVVWRVRDSEFEKIVSIPTYYGSLGLLYEEVSWTIGYDHLEGPGKVMGLAPYGQKSKYYDKLRSYFRFDDKDYPYYISVDGSRPRVVKGDDAIYRRPYRLIAESLFPGRVPWDPRGELNRDATDLAFAVQAVTEEAMLRLAEWAKSHTGEQNLALAGGVALNAKANMAIHYSKLFSDLFIFPAANDAGTTVGAAAYVYEHVLGGKMRRGEA
ncbi:carbamoyltransferase N-terminal domain-containing protein [Vulcanisaeta distributa]|uniref:carbamoyltransferase N-terminal domain-containing protein n=1 Tax=Vulcanisaeta distributa TaxID=164451 RepID=UPI000A99C284|nr:carbamoyltransferase N-terminal domain-containing protein [Vulcanisaeta distributa]